MSKFYETEKIPPKNKIDRVILSEEEIRNFMASETWYQTIDFGGGLVTRGTHVSEEGIGVMGFPEDMDGIRYLDVGSNQGFYVMEAAMRGADAFGIDNKKKQINQAYKISNHFGIKVQYDLVDLMEADVKYKEYATGFDFITVMSMFHHLRRPRRALEIIRGMSKGIMVGEFCCWIDGEKRWGRADELPDDWGVEYHKTYPTIDAVIKELQKLYAKVEVIGSVKAKHRIAVKCQV